MRRSLFLSLQLFSHFGGGDQESFATTPLSRASSPGSPPASCLARWVSWEAGDLGFDSSTRGDTIRLEMGAVSCDLAVEVVCHAWGVAGKGPSAS